MKPKTRHRIFLLTVKKELYLHYRRLWTRRLQLIIQRLSSMMMKTLRLTQKCWSENRVIILRSNKSSIPMFIFSSIEKQYVRPRRGFWSGRDCKLASSYHRYGVWRTNLIPSSVFWNGMRGMDWIPGLHTQRLEEERSFFRILARCLETWLCWVG